MRIIFSGVKRDYLEFRPVYRDIFTKYHLELPWYFAIGGNSIVVTTTNYDDKSYWENVRYISEENSRKDGRYDINVHWRKWFPDLYRGEAINVINCQDHSFSPEWLGNVKQAFNKGQLYGIMCFPGWHKRNLFNELGGAIPSDRLIDGLTLGVDTKIYRPAEQKSPYDMLWASDPGRGLHQAIQLAVSLWKRDKRFRLHVCRPDYAPQVSITHPAIVNYDNLSNGINLWSLFNVCGILPYTSNFMEPSSRAHRQAQAAGSLVLYPPNMGTPSELIEDGITGFVRPVEQWPDLIIKSVEDGSWKEIGKNARRMAKSERWSIQSQRFNEYFGKLLRG